MLNLIPTNQTKKNQADNEDLSDSMILPSSPFKKNSFFTIGFQANPEDNAERKAKVRDFLSEFQVQLQRLQDKDSPLSLRDKIKEDSEAIHAVLDNIFCLFNVDIQLVKQDQSDSACRIEPVIHLGKAIQCLFYIALALSKFPYSFIKIIDLNKFTICKKAQLKSEGYQDVFLARIMTNATFMTEVHDTYEKVEAQFYKVVMHHVIKKVPSIHTEWPIDKSPRQSPRRNDTRFFTFTQSQLNDKFTRAGSPTRTTSPTRTMSPSRTILSPDKTKQKESLEEVKVKERTETFYRLMSNPGYADQASDPRESLKARFLKDKLEFLDPIGVCEEWWDSLLVSDFVVLEKSDGDFAVKRQISK